MADGVDVFDSAARKNDSEFHFVIRLFTDCPIDCPLPSGTILRMNALEPLFPSRHAIFWIKAIYAIPLLGKMQGFSSRTRQTQLPVCVSLCASARLLSLRRNACSACLLPVVSITAPTNSSSPDSPL